MRPRRQVQGLLREGLCEEVNDVECPEDGRGFASGVNDGDILDALGDHHLHGASDRLVVREGDGDARGELGYVAFVLDVGGRRSS